ncbi:MAG TPA: arginine--tRNA ligase, partial [Flavisolibacter sp.]
MNFTDRIKKDTAAAIEDLYKIPFFGDDVVVSTTKPDFEGDYTVVLFTLTRTLSKSPDAIGNELGAYLLDKHPDFFTSFNIIKGFLNFTLGDAAILSLLSTTQAQAATLHASQKVMVEYSSPNTNKPLHLGHLRNNFLGWSIAEILKARGNDVMKTCIVNDRGIHICKSMIAWQEFGAGATPESTGTKGDHFVGDYYVRFNDVYKEEVKELIESGKPKAEAEKEAPIMLKTQQMLVDWENGKPEVMELWKTMNSWVYAGFEQTYKRIGTDFHKSYYESETYLLGRKFVDLGLQKGIFFRKEDGSVWIDLTPDGLDEKLVLRKDGTSVYITQDLG